MLPYAGEQSEELTTVPLTRKKKLLLFAELENPATTPARRAEIHEILSTNNVPRSEWPKGPVEHGVLGGGFRENAPPPPPRSIRDGVVMCVPPVMQWPTGRIPQVGYECVAVDMGYLGHVFYEPFGPRYIGTHGIAPCVAVALWKKQQAFVVHFDSELFEVVVPILELCITQMRPTRVFCISSFEKYAYDDQELTDEEARTLRQTAARYRVHSTKAIVSLVVNLGRRANCPILYVAAQNFVVDIVSGTLYQTQHGPSEGIVDFFRAQAHTPRMDEMTRLVAWQVGTADLANQIRVLEARIRLLTQVKKSYLFALKTGGSLEAPF